MKVQMLGRFFNLRKFILSVAVGILLFAGQVRAADIPYQFSIVPFYANYTAQGSFHDAATYSDFGYAADFGYPYQNGLLIKAITMFGLSTGFEYIGFGGGYNFVSSRVDRRQEEDTIEIISYKKWRPYIDASFGYTSARTRVNVGKINQDVSEDAIMGLGRVGTGYALFPTVEVNYQAFLFYAASSTIGIYGYGVGVGMRLNLF